MSIPPDFYDPTLLPTTVARIDLKTQAAAIAGGTALFTPNISGIYRITAEAMETQVGAVSSTLGGAGGFAVNNTKDADTGAAQATTGTIVSGNNAANANLVGTQSTWEAIVNCTAGQAVTYSFGYTDGGGASHMQYALHIRVIAIL